MLAALHIQDFVLIDKARLSLARGLTALTGETGAGKSILLDALGLAVGARAERRSVRKGAGQCTLTAVFEPLSDHPVWACLEEHGLRIEDDQIILRRVIGADGRSRGFINEEPVSIGALRAVGDFLLEIHGQHDGRGFLAAPAHRAMLDAFGGLEEKADAVGALWRNWRESDEALGERRSRQEATANEAAYLRHVAEMLEALAPHPGEESELAQERARLMATEKIAEDLDAAAATLDHGSPDAMLASALRQMERAAQRLDATDESLVDACARLERALDETGEARLAIGRAIDACGGEPASLEATEERLFALRAEARKHGVEPDALSEFLEKTKAALGEVELGEKAFSNLESAAAKAKADLEKASQAVARARGAAAKKLDAAVAKELKPLKLDKARFSTRVETDPDNPTSSGCDRVEFMAATNPGAPAGPLKAIASGGELSRFVLAMKAALAVKENRTVIIFDEVDAGVGGAVADAVGERLARLAEDAQVLVVTHSPQVAARADNHWRIDKTQTAKTTTTALTLLDESARIEEIARMLAGAEVTVEARAAAKRLLGAPGAPAPLRKKLTKAG